jgi:uncharacterized repeat protein (TIGR02059 family)
MSFVKKNRSMRSLVLMAFLALTSAIYAKTFYVSTLGKDSNPGTYSQPWASWEKAFNSASIQPGDTVYFRGGVYYATVTDGSGMSLTVDGTVTDTVKYWAYPPDFAAGNVPIFDGSNIVPRDEMLQAFDLYDANYIHFKGLTMRNVHEVDRTYSIMVEGWRIVGGRVLVENCTVYNVDGIGFFSVHGGDGDVGEHVFINCDGYNCTNALAKYDPYLPGNRGVAFSAQNFTGVGGKVYYKKCRAWLCGDQGFSNDGDQYIVADSCWAFENGLQEGGGAGFKLGWQDRPYPAGVVRNITSNCLAAYNRMAGIYTNDDVGACALKYVYNNTSYHNGYYPNDKWGNWAAYGWGFWIQPVASGENGKLRYFRNNISFDNSLLNTYDQALGDYTHSNNTWDGGGTVTAADFVKLPSSSEEGLALLKSPRKADGSLPDLDGYFQLIKGSDLIDAGNNVGISFKGTAPDLGCMEYDPGTVESPVSPVFVSAAVENATPSRIDITFSLSLANFVPATSAFAVTVNSSAQAVSSVSVSGTRVLLTLATPVVFGDIVTVAYTKPSSNPLQTSAGGQVASFTAKSVTNNVASEGVNQPPQITISSPTKNTSYTEPANITIYAEASDPNGSIIRVEFFNGSTKIGETTSYPYSYAWKDVPAGIYSITAVAVDNGNASTVSEAVILSVLKSSGSVNQSPSVSITLPERSKKYKKHNNVNIEVIASDPDGFISSVTLKCGDVILAEMYMAPYVYTWCDVDTGSFALTAIAVDNLNATSVSEKVELVVELLDSNYPDVTNIYPNPNFGRFKVEVESGILDNYCRMSIISMTGKTILTRAIGEGENPVEFELPGIAAGSYVLVLTKENAIISTKKFVIH